MREIDLSHNWIAKFVGGPLEGELMAVDTPNVDHYVTAYNSSEVKIYHYIKGRRIGDKIWFYVVDRVTIEDKFQP